jgi:uncharacterized protein (DUF1501 family)
MATLTLPEEVNRTRFQGRRQLQTVLDQQAEDFVRGAVTADMQGHYERAFRLLQSVAARRAFDLAAEPAKVRGRYGDHPFGQSCLLARRLVEGGVPLITVYWNAPHIDDLQHWDTHKNSFDRLQHHLLPHLDRGLTALLEDLASRGLLDETLVVWMGEFGRTPKLNKNAGRDHWGFCQSVLMAGAGVRGGQVYGRSDASAAYAAELPVSPDNLAATVFDTLGIPLNQEMHDAQGRPQPLCNGKPLRGLFS